MFTHSKPEVMPKKAAKKIAKKNAKRPTGAIVPKAGLSFEGVIDSVSRLHTEFLRQATKAVNVSLTLRNWLIGAYIHEYELRGADRAMYGGNPVPELAKTLATKGIPGCAPSSLYSCRNFYRFYPQIGTTVPHLLSVISASPTHLLQMLDTDGVVKDQIFQTVSGKLQTIDVKGVTENQNFQSLTEKSENRLDEITNDEEIPRHSGEEILHKLSYSHIILLLGTDDPYKRAFYEMECLRGGWSVRELKRQINTQYFERTALSTNKAKLREIVKKKAESYEPRMVVRDPMVFEFLGVI